LNVEFLITGLTFRPVGTGPSSAPMVMSWSARVIVPPIRLWCDSEDCDGFRSFDPSDDSEELHVYEGKPLDRFFEFVCRNCRRSTKTLRFGFSNHSSAGGSI